MSDLPTAIWSGEFQIGSVKLKCHVLDNGQRVIDAESVDEFFRFLDDGAPLPSSMDDFARWMRGDD